MEPAELVCLCILFGVEWGGPRIRGGRTHTHTHPHNPHPHERGSGRRVQAEVEAQWAEEVVDIFAMAERMAAESAKKTAAAAAARADPAAAAAAAQVRFCLDRFSLTSDSGYRGGQGRGRVRIQVHCTSGPCHPPQEGWLGFIVILNG
jgi:hypothetical protein